MDMLNSSNYRIQGHSFPYHWITKAVIVICLVQQKILTNLHMLTQSGPVFCSYAYLPSFNLYWNLNRPRYSSVPLLLNGTLLFTSLRPPFWFPPQHSVHAGQHPVNTRGQGRVWGYPCGAYSKRSREKWGLTLHLKVTGIYHGIKKIQMHKSQDVVVLLCEWPRLWVFSTGERRMSSLGPPVESAFVWTHTLSKK